MTPAVDAAEITLDAGVVYEHVQSLFKAGLVTIFGSGASAAFGLPSMSDLATHLLNSVPTEIVGRTSLSGEWEPVAIELRAGTGLETALASQDISDELLSIIAGACAQCVLAKEAAALSQIVEDGTESVYARLFAQLLRTADVVDVITTNYDRLIEVSAAAAGHRFDTMFYGATLGHIGADESADELLIRPDRGRIRGMSARRHRPHLRIAKPHGSLDWFGVGATTVRSDLQIDAERKLVAPGDGKYRMGYEQPFESQRERANEAIDRASGFLSVGYGYNDDHLQVHLKNAFPARPSLLIGYALTPAAVTYLESSSRAVAFESAGAAGGTVIRTRNGSFVVPENIWTLDQLLEKVMLA